MMHEMRFSVHSASESGMLVTHTARAGSLQSDEPQAMGGTNLAPNPIDMLLASWSGCLVASARLVAMERGYDLGAVKATAEAEIDPRSVAGDRTAPAGLLSARARLETTGHVPDPAWLKQEIAARCPISQTLSRTGIEVELEIV